MSTPPLWLWIADLLFRQAVGRTREAESTACSRPSTGMRLLTSMTQSLSGGLSTSMNGNFFERYSLGLYHGFCLRQS